MKNIYLSFMGKKDPFRSCRIAIPGPNISFLTDKKCFYNRCVFLVHDELREKIIPMMDLCSEVVDSDGFAFSTFDCSPVDINGILKFLQTEIKQIIEEYGSDIVIHANISPGTPQMQFCFLLTAMHTPQLKLYQIIDPKFKADKHIVEINLPQMGFQKPEKTAKNNPEKQAENLTGNSVENSAEEHDLFWVNELKMQVDKIKMQVDKINPKPEKITEEQNCEPEKQGIDLPQFLQNLEKNILKQIIKQFPNLSDAARFVGMKPNSFRKKINEQWKLKKRKKNGFS